MGDISIAGGNLPSISLPPRLLNITGGLTVYDAPLVIFEAPGLLSVGTALAANAPDDAVDGFTLFNLPSLTTLNFPNLTTLGSLFGISNCSSLEVIDGFPRIFRIGGSLVLIGTFESVSFPSLQYVGGNLFIQSSNKAFKCPFEELASAGGVQGSFTCGTFGNNTAIFTSLPNVTAVNPSATDTNSPASNPSRSGATHCANVTGKTTLHKYANGKGLTGGIVITILSLVSILWMNLT